MRSHASHHGAGIPGMEHRPVSSRVSSRRSTELAGNAHLTSLLDTLSGSTLRARIWRRAIA